MIKANKALNISFLIDFGTNINDQSETGETALSLACVYGNIEAVKTLLQYGIYYETLKLDIPNYAGYTALMCAVISLNLQPIIIKILCKAGANINHISNDEETALSLARENDNIEVIDILLEYSNTLRKNPKIAMKIR